MFEHGELNLSKVASTHLGEVYLEALRHHRELLLSKGSHPVTEALAFTRSDMVQQRRLRVLYFADNCFGPAWNDGIHPKARLFTAGAIAMINALRLHWVRDRRHPFKSGMLDFVIEDAIRPDNWETRDIAENRLSEVADTTYVNNPLIVQAMSLEGEDRDDGESRALGAGWVCTLARPVELMEMPKNPGTIAVEQIKTALSHLES